PQTEASTGKMKSSGTSVHQAASLWQTQSAFARGSRGNNGGIHKTARLVRTGVNRELAVAESISGGRGVMRQPRQGGSAGQVVKELDRFGSGGEFQHLQGPGLAETIRPRVSHRCEDVLQTLPPLDRGRLLESAAQQRLDVVEHLLQLGRRLLPDHEARAVQGG